MKVSFVINEPVQDATGGYKMVYMYANYLVDRGNNVYIYYICRKGRLFTNYKIPFFIKFIIAYFLSIIGPKWFKLDKRVHGRAIRNVTNNSIRKGDAIVATALNTSYEISKLSNEKGEKYYYIQDYENWEDNDDYVNNSYRLGFKNIVIANWLKKIVDKHSNNNSILISNGIDNTIFYDKHMPRDKHSIVFQYRSNKEKGCEYAIQAIIKLKEKYDDLIVRVISIHDKPSNLPEWCNFYKSITPDEVANINNKSEVFICTSVKEGYGLPGLEAMACGCAVCSSDYEGVHEYAVDGVNALISPVKNVDIMVKNIISIFENEKLKNKLIKNALKTATEKSYEKMGEKFERVIRGEKYE